MQTECAQITNAAVSFIWMFVSVCCVLCYAHQAHYILDGAKRSFEPRREHCVFKACIIIVTYFVAFVAILAVISFIYGHCRLCTLSLSRSVALKSNETHQTTETFTFCGIFHFFSLFSLSRCIYRRIPSLFADLYYCTN